MDIVGFEHLHLHTDYSLLDGFQTVEEVAEHWKGKGEFLCISDHGMMAAVPRQIKACDKYGLNPIFACEVYVNPLQIGYSGDTELQKYIKSLAPDDLKLMRRRGFHLLAIAYNEVGYSNLVKLVSWGWTRGFYYKPRVNHEELLRYKEGIIFTSCCYASEVGQAFEAGGDDAGFAMIEKYISMFGKENYYLEIMLLDFEKQKPYDTFILRAAERYGLRIILTNDCHYCKKEDSEYQRLMLMIQTQNTIADINRKLQEEGIQDLFELQDRNLYVKTEEELNDKWRADYSGIVDYDIFKQAKRNTVELARRAKGVKLDRSIKLPKVDNANDKLKELMIEGFKRRNLPMTKEYLARIQEEYSLICNKEFSSYFLIQKMMTDEARRICPKILGWGDGSQAVGPGRGSACGSLICYCLGITDVNPVKHGLLFKRFLSESRGGKTMKTRFLDSDFIETASV